MGYYTTSHIPAFIDPEQGVYHFVRTQMELEHAAVRLGKPRKSRRLVSGRRRSRIEGVEEFRADQEAIS